MTPEERIQTLEENLTAVQQKFNALTVENAELKRTLTDVNVRLSTEKHRAKQLWNGLLYYAPGPFWTDVVKDTKADQDRGQHADWILRMTDDGSYSRAA